MLKLEFGCSKMKSAKSTWRLETKVKVIAVLLGCGVTIHLALGAFSAIFLNRSDEPKHFRLRPRYAFETVVKGRTYHTHPKKPVDLVIRENYQRRRRQIENLKPHFVARRGILAHDYDEATAKTDDNSFKMYKEIGGEVRSLGLQCGSCAVVGSAGTLTTSKSGPLIDNAECVFRLGMGPVHGFSQDVGSKTHVRVVDGKSFAEILRRPRKLSSGTTSSTIWIVFDHFDVDAMAKLHFKFPQIKRINSTIKLFTVTRKAETEAQYSMKREGIKLGYVMPNKKPSTLWFTMQATAQAGCKTIDVYGIPDPKFCKTCPNGQNSKSRYWGKGSPLFCTHGKDVGSDTDSAQQQFVSLADRRALLALATINPITKISFHAPRWPQAKNI